MRVWATSRLDVITDQPDDRISLALPLPSPPWPSPSSSSAPRPTESVYVQSLQSLRHSMIRPLSHGITRFDFLISYNAPFRYNASLSTGSMCERYYAYRTFLNDVITN